MDPCIQNKLTRKEEGQDVQRHPGAKEHGTFWVQRDWTSEAHARSVEVKARKTGEAKSQMSEVSHRHTKQSKNKQMKNRLELLMWSIWNARSRGMK